MLSKKVFGLLLLLAVSVIAGKYDDSALTDYLNEAVDRGRISGVHAVVAVDGKVEYSKVFGYLDIEKEILLKEDGIYRIASMTKIITSIAALQLLEQGEYQLDEPVSKYLPEFKDIKVFKVGAKRSLAPPWETEKPASEPTIRDLFRHTAGIRLGEIGTKLGLRDWQGTLEGYVETLAGIPLDNNPGTKFEYGFSIDVLGLLIEKWSGQLLDEYCAEHIFKPLGLDDTGFVISSGNLERLVNHYELRDDNLECREDQQSSPFKKRAKGLSGGGGWNYSYPGLLTSVDDWLVVMELIRNGGEYKGVRLLEEETVKEMCKDHLGEIPGFKDGLGYGLGIGVVVDSSVHGLGASDGAVFWAGAPHNTFFYIDFQKKISAVMMMQSGPFTVDDMMNQFWKRSLEVFGSVGE